MLSRQQWSRAWVALVVIAILAASWLPAIQDMASHVVDASLKKALIVFAALRGLNGLVSVAQGTEVQGGVLVEVSVAVGQVLDPINDLLEQASTVMMWATVSLGIQKAILVLSGHWFISALISAVAVGWAAAHYFGKSLPWLTRLMLLMFIVRFLFPVMAIGSHVAFDTFLSREFGQAEQVITKAAGSASQEASAGLGGITNAASILDRVKKVVENLPEAIVRATASFIIQTILLPLAILWALVYVGRGFLIAPRSVRPSMISAAQESR
ncbi:MAG: hypothetical protein RI988_1809 [Pseudomonadota bacterium]